MTGVAWTWHKHGRILLDIKSMHNGKFFSPVEVPSKSSVSHRPFYVIAVTSGRAQCNPLHSSLEGVLSESPTVAANVINRLKSVLERHWLVLNLIPYAPHPGWADFYCVRTEIYNQDLDILQDRCVPKY